MSRVAKAGPWWQEWAWGVALLLAVLLAFSQVPRTGFVWDDDEMVTGNQVVVGPLGLHEIWTTAAADICPLTLTTFWAENKLWGLSPAPWHWVTILLHGLTAIALWRVLLALRVPGAWLGAALWALHPVQAESAAWISETKNTESGLFFLIAVWFFIRWIGANKWRDYGFAILFGALAMAAKSSTVVLPLVLALCAWWMEGRWNRRTVWALAPFFALALVAGIVSIQTQCVMGSGDPQWTRTWPQKLIIAGDAVWFYLGKLAWPYPLIPIYPRWQPDVAQPLAYLPTVAVVALMVVLWIVRGRIGRCWFFAFASFLVALLPVLGFANSMFARFSFVADHFQYLASMAPLALVGAGFALLAQRIGRAGGVAGGVLAAVLGVMTWMHAAIYSDEMTLWKATLKANPGCWSAYTNIGSMLDRQRLYADAIDNYKRALSINPKSSDSYNNMAAAESKMGDVNAALADYQRAVDLNPAYYQAWTNLGVLKARTGQREEAIGNFRRSIAAFPTYASAHYNLAIALFIGGQVDESLQEFETAVALDPSLFGAFSSMGVIAAQKGDLPKAQGYFEHALKLRPEDPDAGNNLAAVLIQQGHSDEAIARYRAVLEKNPDYAKSHAGLGAALLSQGKRDEARQELLTALRLAPGNKDVQRNLEQVMADPSTK